MDKDLSKYSTKCLEQIFEEYTAVLHEGFQYTNIHDCMYLRGEQIPITKSFVEEFLDFLCLELMERDVTDEFN